MAYGGRQWPADAKVSKFSGAMVSTFFHISTPKSSSVEFWIIG